MGCAWSVRFTRFQISTEFKTGFSVMGACRGGLHDLPTAIGYQRKALAIRRDLVASDPKDVWKQERLAYSLTSTADLLIHTHDYQAALADLGNKNG
jgi:hypothetical protein